MRSNPRVLYIAYWGAAEPLGQSLVLPAVKRLAALGVNLTLVTFEKPADLKRTRQIADTDGSLRRLGITWIPLKYHKRPKVPATVFDIANGCARSLATRLRSRVDIIHARTFIGGLIGLALAPLLGARLVFHTEGSYADEQVDSGVWSAESTWHRLTRRLEREMFARADGIITLSRRAKLQVEGMPAVSSRGTTVIVVPSCVDLSHFRPVSFRPHADTDTLRFVYSGSVGGRYDLGRIGRFVATAARELPGVSLRVLTRSDPGLVRVMLDRAELPVRHWSMESVPHESMPAALAKEQVGLHFLPQGLSDHAGSPTKIGEYWAAGLPAIVTRNAGDTSDIISHERVGAVIERHTDDEYKRVLSEVRLLFSENGLAVRCRRAAETHYDLDLACGQQHQLYHNLVSANRPGMAAASQSERQRLNLCLETAAKSPGPDSLDE